MATSADLIRTIASATGVPETTVGTYYRSLREAGMVTKAGRGRSAAHLTVRDAAHVLVAVGGARFDKQPASSIIKEFAYAEGTHISSVGNGVWLPPRYAQDMPNLYVDVREESSKRIAETLFVPELVTLRSFSTVLSSIEIILEGIINGSFIGKIGSKGEIIDSFSIDVIFQIPGELVGIDIFLRGRSRTWQSGGTYRNLPEHYNRNRRVKFATIRGQDGPDIEITRSFSEKTLVATANLLKAFV